MIAQDPVGPGSLGESRFVALDRLANGACLPRRQVHELEIEGQVDLVELLPIVGHQALYWQIQFADGKLTEGWTDFALKGGIYTEGWNLSLRYLEKPLSI